MQICTSALLMIGIDSPVLRSLALKTSLRRIETSAPVSIVLATQVPLIFPGIVGRLLLVKLPIFISLGALFLPASTSPKVPTVFSFPVHFVERICVVCVSLELVIEHDNRVCCENFYTSFSNLSFPSVSNSATLTL